MVDCQPLQMQNMEEPPVELMYRPPGEDDHRNITKVLDDMIIELRTQNQRILELEELVEKLYLEID